MFNEGEYVDVTGTSKGKGFQGVVKRHNFGAVSYTHLDVYKRQIIYSVGCKIKIIFCSAFPSSIGNKNYWDDILFEI